VFEFNEALGCKPVASVLLLNAFNLEICMTDLMNLVFLVASFGLGIGFVWFCEKLK
jgi:hypothetical protein